MITFALHQHDLHRIHGPIIGRVNKRRVNKRLALLQRPCLTCISNYKEGITAAAPEANTALTSVKELKLLKVMLLSVSRRVPSTGGGVLVMPIIEACFNLEEGQKMMTSKALLLGCVMWLIQEVVQMLLWILKVMTPSGSIQNGGVWWRVVISESLETASREVQIVWRFRRNCFKINNNDVCAKQ